MVTMFPVLTGEIAKRGIKKRVIAEALNIGPRSLHNKMTGVSPFTWEEVNITRNQFFPDMELSELFRREDV